MSLPDLGRISQFKAYVVGVHRRVATLQPVARVETMWLPPHVEDVLMSFAHGSQTVGLRGELRCERPDLLRFRVTDGVYVPRRRSSRLRLCAPATVTPLASDGCPEREPLVCQTQDVGPDGVLIEGAIGLRQEQLIELSVTLPEDPDPVQVQARVTEVGEDLSSLEFVALPRQTRRRLTGFVTEQLRRRLNIVHSLRAEEDDDWD